MIKPRFRRLEYLYLVALGCIALAIIISQSLIQTSINRQSDDARVINVAGRQRMLSQKITKVALKISQEEKKVDQNKQELREALSLWKKSHEGLLNGDSTLGLSGQNSDKITSMFGEIEPHFESIYTNANLLINSSNLQTEEFSKALDAILTNEVAFLEQMDSIVFQYDTEARAKVSQLKKTERYLFIGSILIIFLELLFVFRPLAKNIRNTVDELQKSEESSKKMTQELSKLYEELGRSYQDLEAVNVTPESPSLYAKMDLEGKFYYYDDRFLKVMEYEENAPPPDFQTLLFTSGYKSDFIESLFDFLKKGRNWFGEIRLYTEPGDLCWLETFIVPTGLNSEVKIIARDITEFKEAKLKSREINRERIEKSVKEQQFRSALILEGQEEERKRLSRELHDGVGQMLSAMKLQIETFTTSSRPMKMRLEDTKSLMKSIIQEVRRVSFNLTPSSLDDFGLVPAMDKFCQGIDQITKAKVTFKNETRFINRLDSKVETNLYRIVQEAVNNAIKYSKASTIDVEISHDINNLNIYIIDDGKGFDYNRISNSGHFESPGHGIFNMKERTSYVGGEFQLHTAPGNGTKIHITLSLDKND